MLDNLGQILPAAAERFGDKTALIVGEQRFSFAALNDLADRLAGGLAEIGVGAGDRVTIYGANSWEWVVSYYAVPKLGAVLNPINVMLTPEEVAYVANDCGTKVILASKDKGEGILDIGNKSDVEALVLFGADLPAGVSAFNALIERPAPGLVPAPGAPEDLSTICYTSGTTGHPKGAMLSHRAVIYNTAMTASMHVRTAADSVASALPCAHVYGNVVMNGCFLYGMTLVLHPTFDVRAMLASIEQHRVTMFEGVPTMFLFMLADPSFDEYDLSSLVKCTVGGQTMAVAKMEEVEARFGCPLIELWGMTEIAGLGTTFSAYGPRLHGSIGVAMPGVECRIAADDDAARTLARGEVGEFMVRGPIVMDGYYNNEQGTRETIEPDGWLHTGDLATMDEAGRVFIVDRKKDMILTAGYNVYPAEIERVIAVHPDVALVAAGPQAHEAKGEIAMAYVVLKEGASCSADDIIAHCRESLAAYKVPRAVQFVADLPKTSTGKIMRRRLKTLDE
jgi:long-chain acyl-CoA synthetase